MEVTMKSIAIVSLDDLLAKSTAEKLATELKWKFLDLASELEKILILNIRSHLLDNSIIEKKEQRLIEVSAQQKNVVMSIANDMFLSNSNYELLKKTEIILIEQSFDDKIKTNLQNLIKKHSTKTINKKDVNNIIAYLKG